MVSDGGGSSSLMNSGILFGKKRSAIWVLMGLEDSDEIVES